ncbi:MAG: glycosyltransferase family 9 protein [Candidatus Aminicenantales bacterium]
MNDCLLIIRLSSLGDIIHTLPAYAALRRNYPNSKITWIVETKGKDILDFVPGIDEIIVVGSRGWRTKIAKKYSIALDFQGLVKSGLIAFLSRAPKRIGFHRKNLKEPLAAHFYTDRIEEIPEARHVISKNLKLLSLLGIHEDRYQFPLAIPEEIGNAVQEKLQPLGYEKIKKLVIFNVGAAWRTKRWSPESWVKVLEGLDRKTLFPLLLWGNEVERKLAAAISTETHVPPAPFFSIQEILGLVQEAGLVVSGDTFALQAACALSVPVVGLFGPTNPQRNGPFSPRDKVAYHPVECSLCYKRTCESLECMKKITPEEVTHLVLQSLEENG